MMVGWRNLLGIGSDVDDLLVMSKVGKVFALPSLVEDQIKRFSDLDADLYLGWRKDLTTAFRHVNFHANFGEFTQRLSDSLLINIRFCAHELAKRAPEKNISREELDSLRQSAWSLYDEVTKAELSAELSRYLLDHIYLIIEAIDDYDITGASAIEKALNVTLGTIITAPDLAVEARKSAFGEEFWNVMSKTGVLLKVAKTALELEEGVRKLLT